MHNKSFSDENKTNVDASKCVADEMDDILPFSNAYSNKELTDEDLFSLLELSELPFSNYSTDDDEANTTKIMQILSCITTMPSGTKLSGFTWVADTEDDDTKLF